MYTDQKYIDNCPFFWNGLIKELTIRVSDQLKAGELNLIETTLEEVKGAKARLDAIRKTRTRREHHAKKKLSHW